MRIFRQGSATALLTLVFACSAFAGDASMNSSGYITAEKAVNKSLMELDPMASAFLGMLQRFLSLM